MDMNTSRIQKKKSKIRPMQEDDAGGKNKNNRRTQGN